MRSRLSAALGAVAALALIAIACGGSSSYSPSSPSSVPTSSGAGSGSGATADVIITITGMNGGNSFSPNPAGVQSGQKVAWRNADSTAHTATADNGSFDTGNIAPGATSAPVTMSAAGSFQYHCKLHPSMVGTLTVGSGSGGNGY